MGRERGAYFKGLEGERGKDVNGMTSGVTRGVRGRTAPGDTLQGVTAEVKNLYGQIYKE